MTDNSHASIQFDKRHPPRAIFEILVVKIAIAEFCRTFDNKTTLKFNTDLFQWNKNSTINNKYIITRIDYILGFRKNKISTDISPAFVLSVDCWNGVYVYTLGVPKSLLRGPFCFDFVTAWLWVAVVLKKALISNTLCWCTVSKALADDPNIFLCSG